MTERGESRTPLLYSVNILVMLLLFTLSACKEVEQEKVYPRGCFYAGECSVEGFEISINEEHPALDESKCGQEVLDDSVLIQTIGDLQTLAGITFLKGNLRIVESDLTNLDGLESLLCIGGSLEISGNPTLANLDGLSNLTQIGNAIRIGPKDSSPNTALQNIDGLGNVAHLGTHLWITMNPLITDIDALSRITSADNVVILANESLENIDGLTSLTEVRGYLEIGKKNANNTKLENLDGLSNVTYVGEHLWIGYNDSLQNLDGLAKIQWIGDYLAVFGNASLADAAGLNGLKTLCGFLNIAENPQLPNCQATKIREETVLNCGVCVRLNQSDSCPDKNNGCLYDRCVQNDTCDGGAR